MEARYETQGKVEESYVKGMYRKGVLFLTLGLAGLVSGCASQPSNKPAKSERSDEFVFDNSDLGKVVALPGALIKKTSYEVSDMVNAMADILRESQGNQTNPETSQDTSPETK